MRIEARAWRTECGISLLETAIATAIMLTIAAGLLPLAGVALTASEHQELQARTTEYAQDKMEQLMALSLLDTATDTTVFPANLSGGTGLAIGGSSDASAPAAGYVDYLDANGALLTGNPPAMWAYKRVWAITSLSATARQVTVVVVGRPTAGGTPKCTLASIKTSPF